MGTIKRNVLRAWRPSTKDGKDKDLARLRTQRRSEKCAFEERVRRSLAVAMLRRGQVSGGGSEGDKRHTLDLTAKS
jgi:hypothetical protein